MDLVATILLVLISITIGFLLNALVSSMRKNPGDRAAEKVSPPDSLPKEAVRLWRDRSSQQLRVEAGGKVFLSAEELSEGQRDRLIGLAGDLRRWLAGPDTEFSLVEHPLQAAVQPTPSLPATTAMPSHPVDGEPERPDLNPFKVFTRAFRAVQKPTGEIAPESIVAQIDTLLQARLEATPLAARGIRLVETAGQGMAVMVGLERYSAVEAVPDPEVRAAIRQAVAEWEARLAR
ncbi:MAG TPA: hypothetical protein VGA03_08815 [Anaerolineales bacterium]